MGRAIPGRGDTDETTPDPALCAVPFGKTVRVLSDPPEVSLFLLITLTGYSCCRGKGRIFFPIIVSQINPSWCRK